jgi:hypothetical protein
VPRPSVPFERWPEHVYDARYGFTWFIAPNIMVDHVTAIDGTEDTVVAMHKTLDRLLVTHGGSIRAHGGLRIIGDWRAVKSYTPDARKRFVRELSTGRPIASATVVVAPSNAFLRMAIKGADMVLALTTRAKIELSSDVDVVLRREGLTEARVGAFDW